MDGCIIAGRGEKNFALQEGAPQGERSGYRDGSILDVMACWQSVVCRLGQAGVKPAETLPFGLFFLFYFD